MSASEPGPASRPPIRWGPILVFAVLAYMTAVAVARPDFLKVLAPVPPETTVQPTRRPSPQELLQDPAVLKALREMREKNSGRRGGGAPNAGPPESPGRLDAPAGPGNGPEPDALPNAPAPAPPPLPQP